MDASDVKIRQSWYNLRNQAHKILVGEASDPAQQRDTQENPWNFVAKWSHVNMSNPLCNDADSTEQGEVSGSSESGVVEIH